MTDQSPNQDIISKRLDAVERYAKLKGLKDRIGADSKWNLTLDPLYDIADNTIALPHNLAMHIIDVMIEQEERELAKLGVGLS